MRIGFFLCAAFDLQIKGGTMLVNGTKVYDFNECNVEAYLGQLGIPKDRVVIELNGRILSKEEYAIKILKGEDILEIVQFVPGG